MSERGWTIVFQFFFFVLPYACIACIYAALLLWAFGKKGSAALKTATIVSCVACVVSVAAGVAMTFASMSSTAGIGFIFCQWSQLPSGSSCL